MILDSFINCNPNANKTSLGCPGQLPKGVDTVKILLTVLLLDSAASLFLQEFYVLPR